MGKTAVIYARVSTTRQAKEELPIQGQLEQCRKKAEQLEATSVNVYTDEGISGRSDARSGFQAAIAYAEAASVDYFICWSTSRFARNKLDASIYKMRLDKAGVSIAYVSLNIDRDSDAGWVTEGVMELFDEFASRQISADTMRSMIKNARDGYRNGGRPPYGYSSQPAEDNPKRKRLYPEPEESQIVQRIFEMRANKGLGSRSISMTLREEGHKNRKKEWTRGAVASLLRNEAVVGRTVFGKKDGRTGRTRPREQWIIVDSHEPIIDMDLWEKAQKCLDRDAQRALGSPKSNHFFTGILKCGECGAAMHSYSGKGRSRRYHYYTCSAAKNEGTHKGKGIRTDIFDPWMADILAKKAFTKKALNEVLQELKQTVANWSKDQKKIRAGLNRQLSTAQERSENIYDLLEMHGKDTPGLADLTKRLRKHNQIIEDCENKLNKLSQEVPPELTITEENIEEIGYFLRKTIREAADPKNVRNFFSSFVQSITVGKGKARIKYDPSLLIRTRERSTVPGASVWLPDPGSNQGPSD